ncbi:MAG: hypothetical protein U0T81_03775 [Saprospiraceae bacterium]
MDLEIKKVIIGLHYDAGLRDLSKYGQLAFLRIGINLVGDYNNRGFHCPEFQFSLTAYGYPPTRNSSALPSAQVSAYRSHWSDSEHSLKIEMLQFITKIAHRTIGNRDRVT